MDPRDAASRPIDHCAVYTQLDAECVINRQQSSVNGWRYLATCVVVAGVVNNNPTTLGYLVYMVLGDGGHALDKFSKSIVWD